MMDFKSKTYHRNILEKLLKKQVHLMVGKILDIGSKNRRYDHWFKGKITAVDLEANPAQQVLFGNIENGLDFPDQSFDSILCLEVLEYLENYSKAIAEIYRLLKSGGGAVITIPFMYHEHQDKIRLTKNFLLTQFEGFSSLEIKTIGNAYTIIWDILRKKWFLGKKGWGSQLVFYFFLLPLMKLIRRFNLEKTEDSYYSGLFIVLKK